VIVATNAQMYQDTDCTMALLQLFSVAADCAILLTTTDENQLAAGGVENPPAPIRVGSRGLAMHGVRLTAITLVIQ
jgi:hypothetical protein